MRIALTLLMVVVVLLAWYGLWWGWRGRARRQDSVLRLPELPAVPTDLGGPLTEAVGGLYISTTTTGNWQERVVLHGLGRRANAVLGLHPTGVLVDRQDDEPIFIPRAALISVDTAPGIAGKVMGMSQGVLIITWQLGDTTLDSGLRINDLVAQQEWITAAQSLLPYPGPASVSNV